MKTKIWADGSSANGNGGAGYIIQRDGKSVEYSKSTGKKNACEAEIVAALRAIKHLNGDEPCILFTDSQAVFDAVSRGLPCDSAIEQSVALVKATRCKNITVRLLKSQSMDSPEHNRCHVLALIAARKDDMFITIGGGDD